MTPPSSLTLGFIIAVASAACSSSEQTPSGMPPYFSPGPNANSEGSSTPESPGNTADDVAPDPTSMGDPTTPAAQMIDEGGPDATQLSPSDPESPDVPSSADDGGGETEPEETAGEEGAETEPDPPPPPDPPRAPATQVFLLFGQSNMWGVPLPQAVDLEINPRVEVLTVNACGRHGENQWVPAQPPLHGCVGQPGTDPAGPGVGPGDYFGKTLAEAFPQDTILLVPNAIPSVSIDVFQPGQQAYNSMLSRARMAQARGEIRGIIFHQGESDSGQDTWPRRVKTVVDQLRSDLGIGNVPFLAGELPESGCCGGHNTFVAQLPSAIDNAHVVQSDGLADLPDNLHFNLDAQREFGRRYGQVMLDALGL